MSDTLMDKWGYLVHRVYTGGIKKTEDKNNADREQIPIRNRAKSDKIAEELLAELRQTTIPPITSQSGRKKVIGSIGRTITFGYGLTRRGEAEFVKNKKFPRLFRLLAQFGNSIVPKGWKYSAITLNEGVKAKKHKDTKNNGRSIIIGIGNYTGGKVRVWDKDDKNPISYDIKMKPTMFNGNLSFHQTTPFKGERYTIIYYNMVDDGKVKGVEMVGKGAEEEMEGEGIYA